MGVYQFTHDGKGRGRNVEVTGPRKLKDRLDVQERGTEDDGSF